MRTQTKLLTIIALTGLLLAGCNTPGTGVVGTPTSVPPNFNIPATNTLDPNFVLTQTAAAITPTAEGEDGGDDGGGAPPSAGGCQDYAGFVADVTIPDGTPIVPGETFVKTWRMQNLGACTWGSTYQLVQISGETVTAEAPASMPNVPPNGVVDISLTLTLDDTATPGTTAEAVFQMRAPDGSFFGVAPYVSVIASAQSAARCGQVIGVTSSGGAPTITTAHPEVSVAVLPAAVQPAVKRILDAPSTVGIAAYVVGEEDDGLYINHEAAMPLASTVKIVNLIAYARSVSAGDLDPPTSVQLADLERYLLPGFDGNAHQTAVNDLSAEGLVTDGAVTLADVPRMMIEYSSNAAADYLHDRIGQAGIEAAAKAVGLDSQSAPCPILGQFLLMANHDRTEADLVAIETLVGNRTLYGVQVEALLEAYASDAAYRSAEVTWRTDTGRPAIDAQRLFSENLNPQATAADYAQLMADIAGDKLSPADLNPIVREYLEWPMALPANQAIFDSFGYKDGSLPGILTGAYYAERKGDGKTVVVVVFYRDLPTATYLEWQTNATPDALARWLLSDPNAIPVLNTLLIPLGG